MVQQLRPGEPLYSCVVPIDSFTANQDEEIVTFGVLAMRPRTRLSNCWQKIMGAMIQS